MNRNFFHSTPWQLTIASVNFIPKQMLLTAHTALGSWCTTTMEMKRRRRMVDVWQSWRVVVRGVSGEKVGVAMRTALVIR